MPLLRAVIAAMLAVALAQPAVAWRVAEAEAHGSGRATHSSQPDASAHGGISMHPAADGDCTGSASASPCTVVDCAGSCAALPSVDAMLPDDVPDRFSAPAAPRYRPGISAPPEKPPPIA